MDYKKKYEEALERAKGAIKECGDNKGRITMIETIFPELKESEDDRIRKGIIRYLEKSQFGLERYIVDDNIVREYIAWLEKQGEQKPAWSVEDEINLEGIINEIEANKHSAPDYDLVTYDKFLSWLKSLKQRMKG